MLECDPSATPSVIASVLEDAQFEVLTCYGPDEHAAGCDLLENGVCSLVDGADVVVNMLHKSHGGREVLDAVTNIRRPPATVIEMTQPERDATGAATKESPHETIDGAAVVITPVTRDTLVEAIHRSLSIRNRPVQTWGDGVG